MEITCANCRTKIKIPDEKLPKERVVSVPCPKCKDKISIDTRSNAPTPAEEKPPGQSLMEEVDAGSYNADEKPFDFIEQGTKTALVCLADGQMLPKIRPVLEKSGFRTTEPPSAKVALKQMRFHIFDVIVLEENFDVQIESKNHVLDYLQQLPMATRRNIFVVLLSPQYRTMDNLAAFNKSVNLTVNTRNLADFEKIFQSGFSEYTAFYRIFKESLTKVGLV